MTVAMIILLHSALSVSPCSTFLSLPLSLLSQPLLVISPFPQECKAAIKARFLEKKDIRDLRTIDYMVAKGQMDLIETKENWGQKHHLITRLFKGEISKPTFPKDNFMEAFLTGKQDT